MLPAIVLNVDHTHFIQRTSGCQFEPVGFNYDHDEHFRLIEDYWFTEWNKVLRDLDAMQQMGANTIRIHLQTTRILRTPLEPDNQQLDQLEKLLEATNSMGLYLNITGLGAYNKSQQPDWFFAQDEPARWDTQACFWEAVARTTHGHNNVFCLNVINEPIIAGGSRPAGAWLGNCFADGRHYTQFVTLQRNGRDRVALARQWLVMMHTAIRQYDPDHLITLGMMDWNLERPPALYSGFTPDKLIDLLDFVSVHLYPVAGHVQAEVDTLRAFCSGKPVVLEETSHIHCPQTELAHFLQQVRPYISGLFTFYSDIHAEPEADHHHTYNKNMQDTLHFFHQYAYPIFTKQVQT